MPWVFLRLCLFIGLKSAFMRSVSVFLLWFLCRFSVVDRLRLFGAVFPLWVSCFGYSLPVVVLPALRCFPAFDALPVRSIVFYCFGGCSFGWSFCFPLAVSLVARPGFPFGFSRAAFVIDLFLLCLPWLYGFRFCPFSAFPAFIGKI